MSAPKLFMSYSWSSPDHEEWVLRIATELRESGVDVILDKWDLKDGQDTYVFMEKMVNDPDIKKVLMVCDRIYVEKANGRLGGVGTETQIISPEIYNNADQTKFVAIFMELNEEGKPVLPTYYKSRKGFDFTTPDKYSDGFDKILRWVHDKPLHPRPSVGPIPAYLSQPDTCALGTFAAFRRALDAITTGKPYASGALSEYFESTATALEQLRIEDKEGIFDAEVVESIDLFIPPRNEIIQILLAIARYQPNQETISLVHVFFENLIPYLYPPIIGGRLHEQGCDNFRFIIHELFLYCIAALLKHERFEAVKYLLETPYLEKAEPDYGRPAMTRFPVFCQHVASLEDRNKRLQLQRRSLHADLLLERNAGSGMDKQEVMQADFVLLLRDGIDVVLDHATQLWWPTILLHREGLPFTIFARSESPVYFRKICNVLNISEKPSLDRLFGEYENNNLRLPQWRFLPNRIKEWMNLDKIELLNLHRLKVRLPGE